MNHPRQISHADSVFDLRPSAPPAGASPRADSTSRTNGSGSNGSNPAKPPQSATESFVPRPPSQRLDQLVLAPEVRARLQTLLSRIRNHRLLYEDWGLAEIDPRGAHVAFNLYGPPGTGKTMCVEALAAELGRPIIDVSYAEIESKYVGDTGKNIASAFAAARTAGAVLFFDEADSILGKRMTSVTQAADHGVNVARAVMLKQLDSSEGIVAFATNLAHNFDNAFVRRILAHIEIPLPDAPARLALWQRMLGIRVPGREAVDWSALADRSAGLAGGDIKNAVVIALAATAEKRPEERRVATADLLDAIDHVQSARRAVGTQPPTVKEEILP